MRKVRLMNRLSSQAIDLHRSIPKPDDGKAWYRLKNLAGGVGNAEIYIYDEIGLWGVTAADFVRELQYLEAVHIDLRINSPGGDVWDGITIYNALCNHPASVTTYIDGLAASSASFIAQSGAKVFIARNGTMMIHDAEGVCIGNANDMTDMAELLDRTSNNIADIYAQRVSTVNVWRKAMRNMTWYIGKEAVEAGLADDTYEPEQGTDDEPAERRRRATSGARAGNKARVPRPVSTACPTHSTATTDEGSWDANAQTGNLPSPMTVTTAKRVYAWYDSGRIEDGELPKDACKLPHHEVSEEGTPGAAHLAGVRNALARLPQSDIPSGDQDACRNHLQAHLDDADGGEEDSDPDDQSGQQITNSSGDGATDDIETWWNPEVFRAAVATAADQHALYGFDAGAFREIMRAAAEDCPALPEYKPEPQEPVAPVPAIDTREFLTALRKGLL